MAKEQTKTFQLLKQMRLGMFIELFCSFFNYDTDELEKMVLWPRQIELCDLLDGIRKLFWPKARQVGGSVIAGMLACKVAITEKKVSVIIISKNEKEAQYFLKDKVLAVLDSLPAVEGIDWGTWKPFKDKIEFSNGSVIESIPTADDAGRGRSAVRLIIMDEAGVIEHAREIWKAASPAIEKHPNGQMVVISNAKNGSWFNSMLKRINEGHVMEIALFFMNLWTDPARDERWKEVEKTQYDNDVDFYTEYPETIDHMFLQREGFVYPTFDSREGGRHVNTFEPNWSYRLMFGYDHGFEHYAVFLQMVWDPFEDHLYVFDELFLHQKDISEISDEIEGRRRKWEDVGAPEIAWKRVADYSIFSQHGQKTVADLIRMRIGLTFQKSIKYNELGSMDMLRTRFTTDRITIHPRCRETIRQTSELLYDKTGKPKDKDNDSCFAGNTSIETKSWHKKISEIKKGDLIRTHLGYSKALTDGFVTGTEDVIEITFNDGRKIVCTPNHKFLSSKGYLTITELKKCYTNSSMGINISKTVTAIGNELMVAISRAAANYTMMYGNSTEVILTHQHLSSTMKTVIKIIIQSTILPVLQSRLTMRNTEKIKSGLLDLFKINAEPTINLPLEESGIVSNKQKIGKNTEKIPAQSSVESAKSLSQEFPLSQKERDDIFAQIDVEAISEEKQELTISHLIVDYAEEQLLKTNILRSVFAHHHAPISPVKIRKLQKIPVYNFQTEDGTYFANGVIVSNCDVLKYICAELKQQLKKKAPAEPKKYDRKLNKYRRGNLLIGNSGAIQNQSDGLNAWQRY